MATYVAVFQGRTIAEAKMVATTAHPAAIAAIAEEFLRHTELSDDPVLWALLSGERRALRRIARQAVDAAAPGGESQRPSQSP